MPHSNRSAMPQVTAVDDQFGTHRMIEYAAACDTARPLANSSSG
jgi:hypothetical protein